MKTEDPRAIIAAENRRREAAMNPPAPRQPLQAVKIHRRGQYARVRIEAGGIVPVWPATPPPGFLSAEDARELVNGGMATAASAEEVETFLAAQDVQEEGGSEP